MYSHRLNIELRIVQQKRLFLLFNQKRFLYIFAGWKRSYVRSTSKSISKLYISEVGRMMATLVSAETKFCALRRVNFGALYGRCDSQFSLSRSLRLKHRMKSTSVRCFVNHFDIKSRDVLNIHDIHDDKGKNLKPMPFSFRFATGICFPLSSFASCFATTARGIRRRNIAELVRGDFSKNCRFNFAKMWSHGRLLFPRNSKFPKFGTDFHGTLGFMTPPLLINPRRSLLIRFNILAARTGEITRVS